MGGRVGLVACLGLRAIKDGDADELLVNSEHVEQPYDFQNLFDLLLESLEQLVAGQIDLGC